MDNENNIVQDTYGNANDPRVIIKHTAHHTAPIDNLTTGSGIRSTANPLAHNLHEDYDNEEISEIVHQISKPIDRIAVTHAESVPGKQILNKETWIQKKCVQHNIGYKT